MSSLGICCSSFVGVSATCGQLALLPVIGGGVLAPTVPSGMAPYLLCAPRCAMGF